MEQPNTPTLAGQDVVVGKSYTEEGCLQHKLTNQEPVIPPPQVGADN